MTEKILLIQNERSRKLSYLSDGLSDGLSLGREDSVTVGDVVGLEGDTARERARARQIESVASDIKYLITYLAMKTSGSPFCWSTRWSRARVLRSCYCWLHRWYRAWSMGANSERKHVFV